MVQDRTSKSFTSSISIVIPAKANQLANFPLNFLRTGQYTYTDGKSYDRATYGVWWVATGTTAARANTLGTLTTTVRPQDSGYRGYGLALRWVQSQPTS